MATNRWLGTATAVAQVDTLTPGGTIEAGDIFNVILTGEDASTYTLAVVATGTTVNQTCIDIVTAFNASTNALLTPITAGYVGTVGSYTAVTLTADTAGVPFYCSVTTTETGGGAADDQTFARAASTANSGPYDYNTSANWSLAAVPVATNDVVFENGSVNCLYGLDQSSVDLESFSVAKSYTGYIGQAIYPLKVRTDEAYIGYHYGAGSPTGSGRINLDFGSAEAVTVNVYASSSSPAETYLETVRIKSAHASSVLNVFSGIVGVATNYDGETATFATINVQYDANLGSTCKVNVGEGTTLTTFNSTGGTHTIQCAATTINVDGGTVTKSGAGAITTINNNSGTVNLGGSGTVGTLSIGDTASCYPYSSGTITTANIIGTADFRKSNVARTITNCNVYSGAKIYCDLAVLIVTNGLDFVQCDVSDCTLELGRHYTLTRTAI